LSSLGGAAYVLISNSDHVRDSARIAEFFGARVYGPAAERALLEGVCDEWLEDGAEPLPGLRTLALSGSKTPGELAFVLERTTLITGDLVRAFRAGALDILPDAKLSNRAEAVLSVRRLLALSEVDAVLPGDGWPIFRNAQQALRELSARLD
jgi:glyoxylase-like metal-dependent hydrolase (beta-lactamase superfamily II)